MTEETKLTELECHKKFAVDCFNHVWSLLEKENRTGDEDADMVHAAHASRFHWARVGEQVNLARGDWQLSRVYAVLNMPRQARHYAQSCLDICEANGIGDFDLAYAYEALARACAIAGSGKECEEYLMLAEKVAVEIHGDEDRRLFYADLETIPEC